MAMFPLGSVLMPGAVLPLHVFEPRYRELVRHCLAADDHEFGVVLIHRGHEVGGGDERMRVGTVAAIVQVAELVDGRYALMTVGTRRIRIDEWLADDPFPLADVTDWPDDTNDDEHATADDAHVMLRRRVDDAFIRVRRANALAVELGEPAVDLMVEISDDPYLASFHLSALAPIGPADQQRLLEAAGPEQRLELLDGILDDVEALLRFRLQDFDVP